MVIVLKLVSGDTVLGLLALEDEDVTVIQDPFTLEYRIDMKGYRSMVLHRFNPFSEASNVSFKNDSIVSSYYADYDLSDYYYYSLDHCIKFRDKAMSQDIQRASEYIQDLIDNNNKIKPVEEKKYNVSDEVIVSNNITSNTVH